MENGSLCCLALEQTSQESQEVSMKCDLLSKSRVFNLYIGRWPSLLCQTDTEIVLETTLQDGNKTDE